MLRTLETCHWPLRAVRTPRFQLLEGQRVFCKNERYVLPRYGQHVAGGCWSDATSFAHAEAGMDASSLAGRLRFAKPCDRR